MESNPTWGRLTDLYSVGSNNNRLQGVTGPRPKTIAANNSGYRVFRLEANMLGGDTAAHRMHGTAI